jgi:membrane protease YdiL (CAAX protease family)
MPDFLEINKKNFQLFFILSFAFSWLLWTPSFIFTGVQNEFSDIVAGLRVIGTFGPTIAGFLISYMEERSLGVFDLWRRGWHLEKPLYLIPTLLLVPLLCIISFFLATFTEGVVPPEASNIMSDQNVTIIISTFFLGGPLQEEFGWRGYALDRLQSKYNSLSSSLIIGVLWAFWHAPSFFIAGTLQSEQPFYSFFPSVLILSILFTWLYNNTNRSVLVAMLFHTSINASYWIIPINATSFGPLYYTIFLSLATIIVVFTFGSNNLMRESKAKAKKDIAPTEIPSTKIEAIQLKEYNN